MNNKLNMNLMKKVPNVSVYSIENQEAAVAKMTQEQVIQRALENFEDWHEMEAGTATVEQVEDQLIGIKGWAVRKMRPYKRKFWREANDQKGNMYKSINEFPKLRDDEYREVAWGKPYPDGEFRPMWINCPKPSGSFVRFDLHYSGICHSDVHVSDNDLSGCMYPVVPGHELAGVVT